MSGFIKKLWIGRKQKTPASRQGQKLTTIV